MFSLRPKAARKFARQPETTGLRSSRNGTAGNAWGFAANLDVRHHTHHKSMKTLFVVIIASLVFGLTAIAKPTESQKLAGVWLRQEADMRCTNTVAADGSFVELSWFRHSDRTNTYQRTGIWLVKDGRLIETIKSSTNPTEVTPHTSAGRVVHSDTREFVISWQASTNKTVWQRISP